LPEFALPMDSEPASALGPSLNAQNRLDPVPMRCVSGSCDWRCEVEQPLGSTNLTAARLGIR
jgi:hypothetical protein